MQIKHIWFEQNLIIGSGQTTLTEAALSWEFSHVGVVEKGKQDYCQLCHTGVKKFVVIKNNATHIRYQIGFDCYAKLQQFLITHRIESVRMHKLSDHEREIKEYATKYINAAMLIWLRNQTLPRELCKIIEVIDTLGYPSSVGAAELLVDYYRTRRFFSLAHTPLISSSMHQTLDRFPHKSMLPRRINLAGIERIERILHRWEKTEKQREERKERERFLNIIAPLPDGRIVTPRYMYLSHISGCFAFMLELSVIIENNRYDFQIKLWEENPLRSLIQDNASRELLSGNTGMYHASLDATKPARFRIVQKDRDTICMSDADTAQWVERALLHLVREISVEFARHRRLEQRLSDRDQSKGFEQFQKLLSENGWMTVPGIGDFCAEHWKKFHECTDIELSPFCRLIRKFLMDDVIATATKTVAMARHTRFAWSVNCHHFSAFPYHGNSCTQNIFVPIGALDNTLNLKEK